MNSTGSDTIKWSPAGKQIPQQGDGGEISTFADSEGAGALFFVVQKFVELIHKGVDVFELPVDRGKANIGHLVQVFQLFHDQFTDLFAAHFTAQFILENMVPASYTSHSLSWDGGAFPKGSTIVLTDLTDAEKPGYYYYKPTGDENGAVSLSSFTKMGTDSESYQDRAVGSDSTSITEKLIFAVDLENATPVNDGDHTLTLTVIGAEDGQTVTLPLNITTAQARTFALTASNVKSMVDTADIIGSVTSTGSTDVQTSHQHQKLALVFSLQKGDAAASCFPEGAIMTYGSERYTLSGGRFIIPLGSVSSSHDFTVTLETPYAMLDPDSYTLVTQLYVSATANGEKPFGGKEAAKKTSQLTVTEKTAFALDVWGEERLLEKGTAALTVTVAYSDSARQGSGSNAFVTFSVQKKEGAVYLTQNNLLQSITTNAAGSNLLTPTNGVITSPGFLGEGEENITVQFAKENLEPGTYRLLFRVSGDGDSVEVPYNFIVLEAKTDSE